MTQTDNKGYKFTIGHITDIFGKSCVCNMNSLLCLTSR